MKTNEIVIDGTKFNSFAEFVNYMDEIAFDNYKWGGHLDVFNDLLRGGFGNRIEGGSIHWINCEVSKEKLGYSETILWLTQTIKTCHYSNIGHFEKRIEDAKENIGETLYDTIVEIIKTHGPGGVEEGDLADVTFE